MQSFHVNVIGLAAGFCTTIAFVPQIVKILRTKHARDISLYMYIILTTGICLWLIYGILMNALPVIAANTVSFVLCSFILIAKMVYRGR
ncbi:MAG: SemiSWEET transporter [Candidatus Omnitrophota bacterium]